MSDTKAQPGPFDGLPTFGPLPDSLPPQMKSALLELRSALTDPPSMGDKFPFALPPTVAALLDPTPPPAEPRQVGRPITFKPANAVQLVRWVTQGEKVRAAAKRAGIPEASARLILKGQCNAAIRRAVTGAGYPLPDPPAQITRKTPQKARQAHDAAPAGVDAPPPPSAPESEGGLSIEELRARGSRRKAQFEAAGEAPGHWADQNGFRRSDVYRVLNGLSPCKRGAFHEIAVKLGIKAGVAEI